jgi:alpha-tubulin suppressor-like RCC1 family protein
MTSNTTRLFRLICGIAAAAALAACGGGDGGAPPPPPPPPPAVGSATIGASGGVVEGPDGTRLVVAADAVATNTTFRIARTAAGAPELVGLNAVSPIYEVTPHNAEFGTSALFSLPLAAAQVPAGATPVLLKASPGQPWRMVNDTTRVPGALSADLDTLSWFVMAYCQTSNSSGGVGWVIGAPDCPANNSLKLELLDSNGTPIAVSPGNNGTLPPYVTVTGPTTLNFRLTWTRPGTTRTDQVSVTGTGGFRTGFSSNWGAGTGAVVNVTSNYTAGFSVTIDPAIVAGGAPRELRINALASYTTTAFAVGRGNVSAGFDFSTYIPILVRYTGTAPTITQQPTPASVSVVENNAFTLTAAATGPNLSYEWRYYQNTMDTAVRAAEGTNNQATYTSPAAPLSWNGRLYYAHICTNRGAAGLERCVFTQASPLTVTPFTQAVAFTAQPVARDILEGESTTFDATVTGTPTPTLHWHYGVTCSTNLFGIRLCSGTPFANGAGSGPFAGATVGGSTTGTLNLTSVPLAANGTPIALRAEQPGSFAQWSSVVSLTVRARPMAAGFTQQLVSPRTVQQGGSIDFAVQTSGTAPISYFWAIDSIPLPIPGLLPSGRCTGATASFPSEGTMRLANVPLGCDSAVISVGIQNVATPAGTRPTSTALLNVTALPTAPSIGTQPQASTVNEGSRAALTVGYGGTAPIALVLQRMTGGTWVDVAGSATTSAACTSPCTVQTPVLDATDNGAMFRVRLTNAQGSTESNPVTVTVNAVRTPVFATQPAAVTLDAGQNASFSFAVNADTGSFAYQWLANGQPLADGSGVAGNGALQGATVSGASGSGTTGTLTLTGMPLAANGVVLSVRVTRSAGGQSTQRTSSNAALTVNTGIPANAITATQVIAGYEWSLVLRPDRTVWGWGGWTRTDGTVQIANLLPANRALRPVQLYPGALTDVHQVSGWYESFWALKGAPGSTASRVLHWGNARSATDGRGADGNGTPASGTNPIPQFRYNETSPVELLTAVGQPVDRVCAIRGTADRLLMIRAIDDNDATTDCNAGSAKTVWMVGSYTGIANQHNGLVQKMPGLPASGQVGYSPPAVLFTQETTSGTDMIAIALEDGRAYGLGTNFYNGYGLPITGGDPRMYASGRVGGVGGPALLRSDWGAVRGFGAAFYFSLFAIRADGSVMVSGYNWDDELGRGDLASGTYVAGPVPVLAETCSTTACAETLTGVTAIVSTNQTTTLALKNGQLLGWGSTANGLLGPVTGTVQSYPRPVPSSVSGLSALSASHTHALVIGPGGVVYAWGYGIRGALGDGVDGNTRNAPGLVTQ